MIAGRVCLGVPRECQLAQHAIRRGSETNGGKDAECCVMPGTLRHAAMAYEYLRALRPPVRRRSDRFLALLRARAMVTPSAGGLSQ